MSDLVPKLISNFAALAKGDQDTLFEPLQFGLKFLSTLSKSPYSQGLNELSETINSARFCLRFFVLPSALNYFLTNKSLTCNNNNCSLSDNLVVSQKVLDVFYGLSEFPNFLLRVTGNKIVSDKLSNLIPFGRICCAIWFYGCVSNMIIILIKLKKLDQEELANIQDQQKRNQINSDRQNLFIGLITCLTNGPIAFGWAFPSFYQLSDNQIGLLGTLGSAPKLLRALTK